MRRAIVSAVMVLGLAMFTGVWDSWAGEVVFCVSREYQSVVVVDAKGLCGEGEDEYVISGPEVERSEELVPLAVVSENGDCEGGTSGTVTRVGFDSNGDGELGDDEVMAISSSCVTDESGD